MRERDDLRKTVAKLEAFDPHADAPQFTASERALSNMEASGGFYTSADLDTMNFPEPKWAVPGILPEGLTVLAGKPKVGKSWLALDLAISIASGGLALGSVRVEGGDVLYVALEDGQRRLQERQRMLLGPASATRHLTFINRWPRFDDGGIQQLNDWLDSYPDARLVIFDTLKKVRPVGQKYGRLYDDDYEALSTLQAIAIDRAISIIVVHHFNKNDSADDWIDSLSGTTGLTGSADSILGLFRSRHQADAELKGTGRDFEEFAHALRFEDGCRWVLMGDAARYRLSTQRQVIVDVLTDHGVAMTPKEMAAATGKEYNNVKQFMFKMGKAGGYRVTAVTGSRRRWAGYRVIGVTGSGWRRRLTAPTPSYEPLWFPMRAAEDSRTKPQHLSLLLAVIAAMHPYEGDMDSRYEYGAVERHIPIDQGHLLGLAHFSDVETLRRVRLELHAWDYTLHRVRPGQSTVYDIRTRNDSGWVWDAHTVIPFGLLGDPRLKPQHIALYAALAVEAELYRQEQWPRDEHGNAPEDSPTYGTECKVPNSRLDSLAGFTHSTQRRRHLKDLAAYRHIEIVEHGDRARPGRYRLLASVEAEGSWHRFLQEEEARWWRLYEAGELPF